MKAILIGTYFQVLNFLRVKKALFFSFIFPIFLYVVFVFVWGNDSKTYAKFIYSGIVAITVSSNAIMAVGKILVQYNANGMSRLLRTIPYGYYIHVSALILSRIILISCAAILLLLLSYIISGLTISWYGLLRVEFGIVIGMYVFTLLGLLVAELLEDKHSESSISNGIFYAIIFLSDSFYPLTEMNTAFGLVVAVNPITPILRFMRDESGWMLPFLIEIVILQTAVFYISKHKIQKR